jgi:glucosamine--fructose-6-phosphate aminotransferase (isomerizing)
MSEILANIQQQPAVLEAVASYARGEGDATIEAAAALLRRCSRVAFVGIGGSRYAALPAALYLSQAGVDARVIDASEALYYEQIPPDTAVILVSRSGRTAEAVRIAEQMERSGIAYVAVTNELDSPIASGARAAVRVAGESDEGISIRTYTAAVLTMLYLGARVVDQVDLFDRQAKDMLCRLRPLIDTWEDENGDLSDVRYFCFLGRGYSLATAYEGCLLFQELARKPAAATTGAEFRQGPVEVLGPEHAVFVFAPEGRTRGLNLALVGELLATGARVIEIGPPWPDLPEHLAPITQIIPVQFAAYHLARGREDRPGQFRYAALTTESESDLRSPA